MKSEINKVYTERNKLAAAFAHLIKLLTEQEYYGVLHYSKVGRAIHPKEEEWENDWRNILVIILPNLKQLTWHFHDSDFYLIKDLPLLTDYKFDGHTTDEKYETLLDYFVNKGESDAG